MGIAIANVRTGRPTAFGYKHPTCAFGWWGRASWLPHQGNRNAPRYMLWSADGRALIALRALLRDEPRVPATAWPHRFDIVQWALSRSAQGGVLIPRADSPRLSPDGRLIAAYSQRLKSYAEFSRDGRFVRRIRDFGTYAGAPAAR